MVETPGFTVQPLKPEDAREVAKLHVQIFPEYFLAHMGEEFLSLYYAQFAVRPGYGCVAVRDGRIVGFVTGTPDTAAVYNQFYRRNFFRLAWIALKRFFADAFIRREIGARIQHILNAVRSLFTRKTTKKAPSISKVTTRLLSIGVDPICRGQGVADALTDLFCSQLANDGHAQVGLSVFADNARAIGFYIRDGWVLEGKTEQYAYFARPTNKV